MRTDMMAMLLCMTLSMEGRLSSAPSSASAACLPLMPKRESSLRDQPLGASAAASTGWRLRQAQPTASELSSTAMTMSAPMARARETGTG
jgi:hypothetical protein